MPKRFAPPKFNKDNTPQNPSTSVNPDVLRPKQSMLSLDQYLNGYRFESVRLESFKSAKQNFLLQKFSAAGFYYTEVDDELKCFECQKIISNWNLNCNLMAQHKSECRFINNIPCGNVPINEHPEMISIVMNEFRTEDECGYSSTKFPTKSLSASDKNFKKYIFYDNRLESYVKWPKQLSSLKEQLAAAGLYYTGKDDNTKCFECRVEISRWTVDDDPWEDHAKYSRMCHYLFMTKGRKYVNNIIEKTYNRGFVSRGTCTSDEQTKDSDTCIASASSQGIAESTETAESNKKRKSSDIAFSTFDEQTENSDTCIASGSSQGIAEDIETAESNEKRKPSDVAFSTFDEQTKASDTCIASGSSQGIVESTETAESDKKRKLSDIVVNNAISVISFRNFETVTSLFLISIYFLHIIFGFSFSASFHLLNSPDHYKT